MTFPTLTPPRVSEDGERDAPGSKYICLDNIGAIWTDDRAMYRDLSRHLKYLKEVKIAKLDLSDRTIQCLGGWAVLTFKDDRDAADALQM